jgi:hypothetical protein
MLHLGGMSQPRLILGRMVTPDRYDAVWVPGLDTDFDPDQALELALDWLGTVACDGARIIVMFAKNMVGNRPLLTWAAQRYPVVSPRSKSRLPYGRPNSVLAVWPDGQTLELAQRLALDGALCVIPGSLYDVRPWVVRTGATNLADPGGSGEGLPELHPDVTGTLDSVLFFGGHNGFLGGGEKEQVVRRLQDLVRAGHRPDPDAVESYALASGETDHKGARRLREFYAGILAGRKFRDYRGRVI